MTFKELQDALSDWLAVNEKRLPPSARKQLINLALTELQRKALWRFCLYTTNLSILAGTNYTDAPSDMIEPESMSYVNPATGAIVFVEFLPPGEFRARYSPPYATGYPLKYTIIGNQFIFNASPTQPLQCSFTYYRLLPALSNDTDSNQFTDIAWDVVLFTALELASIFGIEDARVPLFAQKKEEALTKLLVADGRIGSNTYRPKSRVPDDAAL